MPQIERFLSPVVVLSLHGLLVFDVVAHRREMLHIAQPLVAVKWASAFAAVFFYLCCITSDPGFLRRDVGSKRLAPPVPMVAIGWLCMPMLWLLDVALRRWRSLRGGIGGVGGGVGASSKEGGGGSGGGRHRDPRDAQEARELQPIGRSALDALGALEADSDPGEETIDPADLEAGVGAAAGRDASADVALAVACDASPPVAAGGGSDGSLLARSIGRPYGRPMPESGPQDSEVGKVGDSHSSQKRSSLGAVPGSPRPGVGRKRRDGSAAAHTNASGEGTRAFQSGQRLRYCKPCGMHQPLRTKHCRDCDRCVRTHDHHCPWVGTCVAEGNRLYFYWFLAAQCLELCIFFYEGAFGEEPAQNGRHHHGAWVSQSPMLMLGLVLIGLLLSFVVCLLSFHTYLATTNLTTWEYQSWDNISYLRGMPQEKGSPFSVSLRENLAAYCCPPWFQAWPQTILARTEDDWAIWEMRDQHVPKLLEHQCCQCCDMEGG